MKVNVYLPDEIGERAKAAELNLSGLLRGAVEDELRRRQALEGMNVEEHELRLEGDGGSYIGVLRGVQVGEPYGHRKAYTAYVAEDGRILIHDESRGSVEDVEDVEELRDEEPDVYVAAMHALGRQPRVSI